MQDTRHIVYILPVIAVFALCAALLGDSMLNHDTSWYLISTRWWLDGVKIYDEISELNPPLAFYLTVPPVFAAEILGINPITAMKLYVFILTAISLAWGWRILSEMPWISDRENMAMLICASIALLIVPIGYFAQREHLMVILAWPYVASALANPKQMNAARTPMIAIGVFSGIGFALKPYFLAIPLAITIIRCFLNRSFRPIFSTVNMAVLAVCVIYLLGSMVLHPAYFTEIIPKTVMTYDAYKMSTVDILRTSMDGLAVILVSVYLNFRLKSPYSYGAWILIAACFGGITSFIVQSKGWGYQIIPFQSFVVIFLFWLFLGLLSNQKEKWIAVAVFILPVILYIIPALKNGPYDNPVAKELAGYFTCPAGQRSYQTFASNVYPSFPLGNLAHAVPSNRAPALWIFPGVVHMLAQPISQQQNKELLQVLDDARVKVVADFTRTKPQLVIVDANPEKAYFNGAKFDYIDFFLKNEAFRNAWPDYSLVGEVRGFQIYRRDGCEVGIGTS